MAEKITLAPGRLHERQAADSAAGDPSEDRMRRALEQLGGGSGQGSSGHNSSGHNGGRSNGAYGARSTTESQSQTGARKHRFVQDGDVPVTHVQARRERGQRAAAQAAFPAAFTAEGKPHESQDALTEEQGLRQRAERALQEAQALIATLKTKLGHAELALDETRARHQADAEAIAALQAQVQEQAARSASLQTSLDEVEQQRHGLETTLDEERQVHRAALTARAKPKSQSETPAIPAAASPAPRARNVAKSTRSVARSEKLRVADLQEPEPVKWWLNKKD